MTTLTPGQKNLFKQADKAVGKLNDTVRELGKLMDDCRQQPETTDESFNKLHDRLAAKVGQVLTPTPDVDKLPRDERDKLINIGRTGSIS
jgi:hypothetical protein